MCMGKSLSSFIRPWSTPGQSKPTKSSHAWEKLLDNYCSLIRLHLTTYAKQLTLWSNTSQALHRYAIVPHINSQQYSQNIGSLRKVPMRTWPPVSLVAFFFTLRLCIVFDSVLPIWFNWFFCICLIGQPRLLSAVKQVQNTRLSILFCVKWRTGILRSSFLRVASLLISNGNSCRNTQ